ncbi:MAG: ABC transporter substrate-binding protein [Chloroflexota bacterium]
MKNRLTTLIAALVAALLLVACVAVPVAEPASDGAAADTLATTEDSTSETEADSAMTDTCEAGFNLIEHEHIMGTSICVPVSPERIAVLDFNQTSLFLALDIAPVVYSSTWQEMISTQNPELSGQLEELLTDARDAGSTAGFSLETVAAAQPDLILAPNYYPDTYDALAEIAPTVMYDVENMNWREHMLLTGHSIGRSVEVEELFTSVDARLEQLTATIADEGSTPSISVLGFYGDPVPYALFDSFAFADILRQAEIPLHPVGGMSSDEIMAEYGSPVLPVSLEMLDLIDAERLLVVVDTAEGEGFFGDLQQEAVWGNLSVVQSEQVHARGSYWYSANPYDLHKIIDDLFQIVAGVDPADISPNPLVNE